MRIFICGDSSCSKMRESMRPYCGWGEKFPECLPGIEVINAAESGTSSKSFLEEGFLQKVLDQLASGDLMLIQLGGNDFQKDRADLYSDPATTYPAYLTRYIREARARDAIPVLMTSVWLQRYDGDEPIDLLYAYNDAVRALAKRENVPLIDVVTEAMRHHRQLTKTESETYYCVFPAGVCEEFPNGRDDHNHSTPKGAMFNAGIVAENLRRLHLV